MHWLQRFLWGRFTERDNKCHRNCVVFLCQLEVSLREQARQGEQNPSYGKPQRSSLTRNSIDSSGPPLKNEGHSHCLQMNTHYHKYSRYAHTHTHTNCVKLYRYAGLWRDLLRGELSGQPYAFTHTVQHARTHTHSSITNPLWTPALSVWIFFKQMAPVRNT